MKKLLLCLLLLPAVSWAIPVCTAVNFSASTDGTQALQTFTLPTGHALNDLDLIFTSARGGGGATTTTDPVGYTLLKAYSTNDFEIWGKIDNGAETNPSVTWSDTNVHVGFMLTLRSTTGWPALSGIVIDSTTGTNSVTTQRYRSLTVTTDNTCAIQSSAKNTTTALSTPTVNVTSGYTAGGIGFHNTASSIVLSTQFQSQGAHTNLSQNDETINGNVDNNAPRGIALTLAMNTTSAPVASVAPAIGTRTTSTIPVTTTTACTDCNFYGVAITAGSGTPTCTQIQAGQDASGAAAYKAFGPIAMTTTVQNTGTFSTYTDGTVKDGGFCFHSTANGDSILYALSSMYKIPAFSAGPTFSSTSTGGATYTETLDGAGTIYGVACKAGSTAATVTQVEAGQCTGGVAAEAAANTSGGSLTIGTTLTLPIYDIDIAATYGSQHEAAIHADTGRMLTAPSTCGGNGTTACQYITIASIGTGSPCESFNTATSPDIAASDILKAPTTTHAGSYALTIGTNCQFSYTGDTSRQDALNIAVYDYSAKAFHADDIDFWANNLPPVAAYTDSLVFPMQVGTPITPIPLAQYCPDPEGDTVTVTAVSGLAAGLSIVASSITGTPSSPGTSVLTLRCTDTPGDYVDWQ